MKNNVLPSDYIDMIMQPKLETPQETQPTAGYHSVKVKASTTEILPQQPCGRQD